MKREASKLKKIGFVGRIDSNVNKGLRNKTGHLGSRASCGSGYLIFLYVLTAIFLRFLKAYSLKNLKNKVSNFFFGPHGNNK